MILQKKCNSKTLDGIIYGIQASIHRIQLEEFGGGINKIIIVPKTLYVESLNFVILSSKLKTVLRQECTNTL